MRHRPTTSSQRQPTPQSARPPDTRVPAQGPQSPVERAWQRAPLAAGAVPWTFRQTLLGMTLTLAPWLALAFALAATPQSASGQSSRRLAPALDGASGVLIFVISATLEAVFTLAPVYYALRPALAPPQANGAAVTATRDWRTQWRLASARLGLTGWATADTSPSDTSPSDTSPSDTSPSDTSPSDTSPSDTSAEGAALGAALGAVAARAERPGHRWRMVWLTLGLSAATLAASALYSYVITVTHAPIATNSDALAQQAQTAPLTVLGSLLAAVFVAPICEEVFFRAFLFRGLLRGMPLWPAILLSSLLFAVAHADLGSFIPLLIIGVALAFARARARSLWPSVAIHTLNNLVAALLLVPTLITALSK